MRIIDLFGRGQPVLSFEFFPPKTESGTRALLKTVVELKEFSPAYVSVTYGAMGTTRHKTVDLAVQFKAELGVETLCHLSCVGATREVLTEVLGELQAARIDNVLALGGDPPKDSADCVLPEDGFTHANELAAFVKSQGDFCVGGACYPEGHIDAPSKESDLFYCKKKVEDGVDFLITQLFFDNRDYFDFVQRARDVGIDVPIVPGIMPITNFKQIRRFTRLCGATIPTAVEEALSPLEDDLEQVEDYGVTYAAGQCQELLDGGAPGLHLYTLNRSRSTIRILERLGLAP